MLAEAYWWGAPWPDTVTAIFTVILTAGVGLAWLQLRDTRRTRDADIVQQLMALWDSLRMIEARKLIATYADAQGVRRMADDFKRARTNQSDEYFLFTYHLNFWEVAGQAFGNNRRSLKLVSYLFGDLLWYAWITWEAVLKEAYPNNPDIGGAFRRTCSNSNARNGASSTSARSGCG